MNETDYNYIYSVHEYEDRGTILKPTEKEFWSVYEIGELKGWKDVPRELLGDRSKGKILRDARSFMGRHFKLHRIPYKNLLNGLDWIWLMHGHDMKKIAKLCNATNVKINPFSLPVEFSGNDETEVSIVTNSSYINNTEFLKYIDVSYRKIILDRRITELTESSYIHEVTHTQISRRGIIKNYLNSEVVPIFIELLNMYEAGSEIQRVGDFKRVLELMDHFSVLYTATLDDVNVEGDLINSSVYAVSILKAYELFIEYVCGTNSLKKYILNSIQNLFNGDLQLEEILDEFEITETSCLENRKLLKYFESRIR